MRQDTQVKNVFVLCTGRCGSTTFTKAFEHASNWTSGHETRSHLLGPDRLNYPCWHIEADNRLSWILGRLDRAFGKRALYIHLTRDPEAVARSYEQRINKGIMRAYARGILLNTSKLPKDISPYEFARDYVDTVTENIRLFLQDKPNKMEFRLETACDDTEKLWAHLELSGNLEAALAEWDIKHNAALNKADSYQRRSILGRLRHFK